METLANIEQDFLNRHGPAEQYEDDLPGTRIEHGDQEYIVHGVPHDPGPDQELLGPDVRETIEDRIDDYLDRGEAVLLEEDLDECFSGIEGDYQSLDDKSHAYRTGDHPEPFQFSDKPGTLEYWIRSMTGGMPELPTAGTPTAFQQEPLREGLDDPDRLDDLQAFAVQQYMEEGERYPTRNQRMVDTAAASENDTVHIVAGSGHHPGLVERLTSMEPDYTPDIDPRHEPDLHDDEIAMGQEDLKYSLYFNLGSIGANIGTMAGIATAVAGIGTNDPGMAAIGTGTAASSVTFDSVKGSLIDRWRER
jgi:hypothetical protein